LVGSLAVVDLIPREGVVNEGTATAPVLRYPECMEDGIVAEITVRDTVGQGGSVCFSTTGDYLHNCGLLCETDVCAPTFAYGFATSGVEPCPVTVSSATSTWGAIKAIFR
jgi:hypothetical protein